MKQKYTGLTDAQALESRSAHGENIITPAERTPLWKRFLAKFNDPLITILLVAGALSVGISCYEWAALGKTATVFFEPVGIFVAILLATGLAFIFETKAEREFEVLNKVNDDEPVTVVRNSRAVTVRKRDVVVGDIVMLSAGQEVPADGTLLEATMMSIDESSLTGEPLCHKTTDERLFDSEATYASNRALRGTKVMEGHGVMRVEAVGDSTENGRVQTEVQMEDGAQTPLSRQFDGLSKLIAWASYAIGALVIVGRAVVWFVWMDEPGLQVVDFVAYLLQSVMIAVTLVVCAVPEGLPMAVTLSLAYSMRRMLKTNNLVRKLHACETMGAATVICTDKTGTLTQNRMTVVETDGDKEEMEACMALCSTAVIGGDGQPIGNPTEGALLMWLKSQNADYETLRGSVRKTAEEPFDTERKYMSVTVETDDEGRTTHTYVKGAPEVVARMTGCELPDIVTQWQRKAMRTLAFATDGQWVGCCAISDPLREDVPEAVRELRAAGIEIKIVTGDSQTMANEIGRQIGVGEQDITARAKPLDKKRLVEELQKQGHVVAVTGDGTNDAPALRAAHVGLSMGDGTAVAKEASDITIIDNSLASIGRAVMWGRSLYQNIQRFIMFQMTINVVACAVVLAGAFMDTESPLSVTQMLWVNLIMDTFAAMALASLPPNPRVMKDKPRSPSAFIITRAMTLRIAGVGAAFSVVLIALLYWMQHVETETLFDLFTLETSSHRHASPHELSLLFTIFVMMQFWNMFNARAFATGRSGLRLKGCRGFVFIATLILVGQIVIVQTAGDFFNVTPLAPSEWAAIIAGTSPILLLGELKRLIKA